jgi:hypothetical protein
MVPRELAPAISVLQADRRHGLDQRRDHAWRQLVTIEDVESGDGGIGAMR